MLRMRKMFSSGPNARNRHQESSRDPVTGHTRVGTDCWNYQKAQEEKWEAYHRERQAHELLARALIAVGGVHF